MTQRSGNRFLVVGGAGFIGSNLVHRLVSEGAHVEVVDTFLTGSRDNLPPGVPLHEVSAVGPEFLERFDGTGWDAIFHFGGASSAPLFEQRPPHMHEAVAAFQNVLELARHDRTPVAFASTSSMYSGCPKPYREDMHVQPTTLYEASKLSMENAGRAYAARYGVPVTAFRFFSVYGPREEGKGPFANIVSQFLWCMRSGIQPVVYGDGSQTRDFTHVDDLLDALLLAYPKTEGFEAYNIGTGVEHTFNQVLAMLEAELGQPAGAVYVDNPIPNYVQETQADSSKLQALGWRPRTTFAQGVQRLVRETPSVSPQTVARMRAAHAATAIAA